MKRRSNSSNYIILALVCLIAFHTGSILINIGRNNSEINIGDEAKAVFSQEKMKVERHYFFISLFSRTSSIINLYANEHFVDISQGGYKGDNLSIGGRLSNFFKAQIPWFFFKKDLALTETGEAKENIDIENDPSIIDDFIIIDRLEEYENLIIIEETEGDVSAENIPPPLNIQPLKIDKEKPYILIYHTHGTESYSSLDNNMHHTTDRNYNIITIGEIICKALEAKGHKVEHVIKYHDIPSYSQSYSKSLKTIKEKLEQNSNLKILLDIHRDGYDHKDPDIIKNMENLLNKTKININGKEVATFFLVIGPDSPNSEAVLNFAKYIKAVSDVLYPGLCTGIMIKPVGKYNQFLSDYSALIEVGSNLNTMEEARETASLLGDILSVVIENIQ